MPRRSGCAGCSSPTGATACFGSTSGEPKCSVMATPSSLEPPGRRMLDRGAAAGGCQRGGVELCLLELGDLPLAVDAELRRADLVVQLEDRVEQHFRPGRTAREIDVDGHDVVDALDDRVVVEHA